jgi:hypothetical protein
MFFGTAHRHLHSYHCHCQRCRKTAAFLSRIPPPANDVGQRRAGGVCVCGETSTVPLPLQPDRNNDPVPSSFSVVSPMATADIGGRHHSLVIVLLLQTIAVIFLVLLLPPKRTPFPDQETIPRRATFDHNDGPGSIHAHGLS